MESILDLFFRWRDTKVNSGTNMGVWQCIKILWKTNPVVFDEPRSRTILLFTCIAWFKGTRILCLNTSDNSVRDLMAIFAPSSSNHLVGSFTNTASIPSTSRIHGFLGRLFLVLFIFVSIIILIIVAFISLSSSPLASPLESPTLLSPGSLSEFSLCLDVCDFCVESISQTIMWYW